MQKTIKYFLPALFACLMMLAMAFYINQETQKRIHDNASTSVANVAYALAHTQDLLLTQIDRYLQSLALHYLDVLSSPEYLDELKKELLYEKSLFDMVNHLAIVDAQGRQIISSIGQNLDLSATEYFLTVKSSGDQLVYSSPFQPDYSTDWVITMSRGIYSPSGTFSGAIVAFLSVEQLGASYKKIDLGETGIVNLRAADFAQIIREPLLSGAGKGPGNRNVSQTFQNLIKQHPDRYVYTTVAPIDGTERVYAYQRFENHPFLMTVGRAVKDFEGQSIGWALWGLTLLISGFLLHGAYRLTVMFRLMAEQSHQLQQALDQARLANIEKSNFLSNVSHELRTPLHAIKSFSNIIAKQINDEKLSKFLNNIQVSCDRLKRVVDDLLDLAKLESGKYSFNWSAENISSLLEEVSSEVFALLEDRRITLVCHCDDQLVAEVDRDKIHQVMLNLLSNAIKFSPDDSKIEVSVSAEKPHLVKVSIRDYGIGIPVQEQGLVFESFKQSSKTNTGAGGTGLGLAICKNIVEAHSGYIWVESQSAEIDEGTKFSFTLPLKQLHQEETKLSADSFQLLKNKQLLFVEDSKIIITMYEEVFHSLGVKIMTAKSAADALAIAAENNFDYIITDIYMPDMDGFELTRQLRQTGFNKPVIALTSASSDKEHADILEAGVDLVLQKPLRIDEFARAVAGLTG